MNKLSILQEAEAKRSWIPQKEEKDKQKVA
jgi:hypothetical protein